MAFKDDILEFLDNKIISPSGIEVMMDWESPIMEKSAEFVCHNKGDILEIGFGMGICADYIQSQNVNSHTIIEIHPQIIEKLNEWASNKSNVTIVEGDWNELDNLSTYDGIFLDTFGDLNLDKFKNFALDKSKEGGKITYWNNEEKEYNPYEFDSISYEKVSITPEFNNYTVMQNNYYMPKVEL